MEKSFKYQCSKCMDEAVAESEIALYCATCANFAKKERGEKIKIGITPFNSSKISLPDMKKVSGKMTSVFDLVKNQVTDTVVNASNIVSEKVSDIDVASTLSNAKKETVEFAENVSGKLHSFIKNLKKDDNRL